MLDIYLPLHLAAFDGVGIPMASVDPAVAFACQDEDLKVNDAELVQLKLS